ncbi:MAG: NADH-quinone oxidoreductase subunit N, partial [Pseudomonadota bacterium]
MVVKIPELAFGFIIPEIIITLSAVITLLLAAFGRRESVGALTGAVALTGAGLAMIFTCTLWDGSASIFNNLYTIDNFGTFFKGLALIVSLLVTLLSLRYAERENIIKGEYYSLLLFGVLGMMIMVSSTNFITIFIGLEVMSIAVYVLCGLLSGNPRSVEASLKYFLLGAFATAFLLYGMALIYATTGSLDIREIADYVASGNFKPTPMFMIGLAMLIVGFGFKTASVPFHMWTPDVYQGAPTSITAYMATGIKAAAFGAFLRVFYTAFLPFIGEWSGILWLIAVATMTLGNITALVQDDVKRMLAYSSIAHAGYI